MSEKEKVRPFPHDYATGIKEGTVVYFAWQSLMQWNDEIVCIIGKTKSEVIHALVRYGVDIEAIDPEIITPVAIMNPDGVTTRSAGRFSPVIHESPEAVQKKTEPLGKPKTPPPVEIDDEDDLI